MGIRFYREWKREYINGTNEKRKLFIITGASCVGKSTASEILFHYIAVVTREEVLRERMIGGRKVTDENWINSSVQFNQWIRENAEKVAPSIRLVDGSYLTAEQTAIEIDKIIREYLFE